MTVWIVTTEIEISNEISTEIIGVYASEEAARKIQGNLINQNAHDVIAFGCDMVDVWVSEWEVEGGFENGY